MHAETCFNCRNETGRAGRADDSIYVCDGEIGPLCEPCYTKLRAEMVAESDIGEEANRLRAAARELLRTDGGDKSDYWNASENFKARGELMRLLGMLSPEEESLRCR